MAKAAKKVGFYTLGCKLNFSETSSIGKLFKNEGFETVEFSEPADVYVINTCSVTENADKKCKKIVRKALKVNENALIAIIGCYAQLKPTEIASIPGVDLVLGASEKFNLVNHIKDLVKREKALILEGEIDEVKDFIPAFSSDDRTRTFLKVQDGCDYSCTYCTIPLARGASRSGKIQDIVKDARNIGASGVKEIVLTGVNIGDFGVGTEKTFLDLVKQLDQVETIERFRISSIEPNLLTNEIIEFVAASNRFVPHFHIPLQSGSDKILGLMRRRYKRDLYVDRVQKIKELMPHCCVGVDVIVGFPNETREDFLETYEFLNKLDISYLHVFSFSERENTLAAQMTGKLPGEAKSERSKMLHILSDKKRKYFYDAHISNVREVLFEENQRKGLMYGFTDNYIKVQTPYKKSLANTIARVKLQPSLDEALAVEVISS
ncbi:MAG: threonylcarbamoyladenosine tRNA methylthiotransferase MtaB [Sphingobacteriales bacterium]|jgi:threonylcarbamoyladenosine tRNA methylthiotransferase MtaB